MGVFALTGAAGGLGSAIRRRIEQEGHRCIGVDLAGCEVEADLATREGRDAAVEEVAKASSGSLDGAVACAGLSGTVKPCSLVARVNYFGAVAFIDGTRALLAEGDGRAAVAICSNSASFVSPGPRPLIEAMLSGDEAGAAAIADTLDGQTVYLESKAALARAVRRRAGSWGGDGLRLNGVAPGPVPTPLLKAGLDDPVEGPAIRDFPVPLGRWGEPSEIADAVWFMLGASASWIHGSILFVDGGTDALVRPEAL